MRLINSKDDFMWYCKELDAKHKYTHDHENTPERYPCAVESNRYEPSHAHPYTFAHRFYYKDKNVCETCNHVTHGWPAGVEDSIKNPTPYDD